MAVGQIAPHPPLQGSGPLAEGGAAASVDAQDRQAREIADDRVDLRREGSALELCQIDAEPRLLTVSGQRLRVNLGEEGGLGEALLTEALLHGLPGGGLHEGAVSDEGRRKVPIGLRDRQLRRRVDAVQAVLPVVEVLLVGLASPEPFHRLHIVLEGVRGSPPGVRSGPSLVELFPLAEDVEHTPAIDEDVVETQEKPSLTLAGARVAHVEARPLRRVEALTRHLLPDSFDALGAR